MKLTKLLSVVLASLMLFTACEETEGGEVQEKETADVVAEETIPEPEPEIEPEIETEPEPEIPLAVDVDALLAQFGLEVVPASEYDWCRESAVEICTAIKNSDKDALADKITDTPAFYEGMKRDLHPEYYDALDKLVIDSYSLYKCAPTEKRKAEREAQGAYASGSEIYFAVFDVVKSELENVKVGENACFIKPSMETFEMDFIRSDKNVFDPIKVDELFFYDYGKYSEFEKEMINFADDMAFWFRDKFEDGRNNPANLDFSMSRCFIYHSMDPIALNAYSFNEINEYIRKTFDGHAGLSDFTPEQHKEWAIYDYQNSSFNRTEKMYGCGGHGGSWIMCESPVLTDNGNTYTVEIQAYADFAKLAKAKKMTFVFEKCDYVKLLYVDVTENTGRKILTDGI